MRIGDFSARSVACVTALLVAVAPLAAPSQTCAQTKWTGARQGFNVFSPEQEIEIGRNSVIAVDKYLTLLSDASVNEYINRLGQTLAARSPTLRFPFSFKIVNSPEVDAFAFPGGPVYITRGTIEAARTEGELAGVIAHEIAHVALRQGASQASKAYLAQAGLGVLGGIAGEGKVVSIVGAVGGFGFNTIFLKYSPEAEAEANALAARILERAGYDAGEMTNFFQSLRRNARGDASNHPVFLEDHPNDPQGDLQDDPQGDQLSEENRVEQKDRVAAQPRETRPEGGDFQRIQTYVASLPRAFNHSPVARRGPTPMEEPTP